MMDIDYQQDRETLQFKLSIAAMLISGFYVLIGIAPTLLYGYDNTLTSNIRSLGGAICHQMPSRCLWFRDFPCGICSKCLGFYVGVFVSTAIFVLKKFVITKKISIAFSLILIVIVVDSFLGFTASASFRYLYVNFLFSFLAGVGSLSLSLNFIHAVRVLGQALMKIRKCRKR